jgi:hypothetical protein
MSHSGMEGKKDYTHDSNLYEYVLKKTERLSSAIYLVTNFVPENEPLRLLVRERSLRLYSELVSLRTQTIKHPGVNPFLSLISEIIGFLEIGYSSGYISEMNYEVLRREYASLGSALEGRGQELESRRVVVDKESLTVSTIPERTQRKELSEKKKDISPRLAPPAISKTSSGLPKPPSIGQVTIRHNSRRDAILNLLNQKSQVTVKDVSEIIAGCSEKTLQRELLSLVEQGVLKKEGERRWSKYSLA